jgi:hypothetical protein
MKKLLFIHRRFSAGGLFLLINFFVTLSEVEVCSAQTNVSGGIYANTTWTLANSPYIVVDTVVVFPGVTLTIDPGVTVKFANTKYLELRQASIIAIGTIIDSITFTSNAASPTPGIWNRIWRNGGAMNCSFNYCNFKYGATVVTGADTIRNSNFNFNYSGCSGVLYVDSCNFINNTSIGVRASFIYNSNILHNQTGIYAYFEGRQVKNCVIDSNVTGVDARTFTLDNCTIKYNQTGIDFGVDVWRSIKNCFIDSNVIMGAGLGPGDSLVNCEVKYNGVGVYCQQNNFISRNIIENNSLGIDLGYSGNVHSNIIENNDTGIVVWTNSNNVYCNRVCNNASYDLILTNSLSVNMPNNYWCTPDSISTTTRIYDGYDNISLGLVNFMPLDVNNCYLTGCNLTVNANVTNATCDTCHTGSATANVTYGFPPYSYTWYTTPIQTTQTATALASGTYTVCVTDGHGCTACNYNVFVDSTNCTGFGVNATATNASCSSCADGMGIATVNAGTPPFNYTWFTSPIQTNDTAFGLATGTYAVCVTDAYGCSACDTVAVSVGSCSAYYTVSAAGPPHTYDLTNMASGTPPLSYDWDWGDASAHDTVPYPSHTYAAANTYTICLTITDSAGCTDTYCHSFFLLSPLSSIYINVIPPTTTGIAEANAKSFSVYPNPTKSFLTIKSPQPIDNISIYSIDGREVKSVTGNQSSGISFDVEDLSSGIYFVQVNKTSRQRFVKQ